MAHLRLCTLVCGSTSASLITPDMASPKLPVRQVPLRLPGDGGMTGQKKCSAGAEHFWECDVDGSPEALQLGLR